MSSSALPPAAIPLFSRSLALVQAWLRELSPAAATAHAALAPPVPQATTTSAAGSAAAPPKPAAAVSSSTTATAAAAAGAPTSMSMVILMIGTVRSVAKHPDSDTLYVELIDLGEAKPRTIISGLVNYITPEAFTGKQVVVVANLEPRKMRGVLSEGMVLCASNEGKATVKLLEVPAGVANGERITFPGHQGAPEPVLKKKLAACWDEVAPLLRTDGHGQALYGELPFLTSKGPVTCASIPNGHVS